MPSWCMKRSLDQDHDHNKDGDENDDKRERLIACLPCLHACCMKRTLTVPRLHDTHSSYFKSFINSVKNIINICWRL